MYAVVAVASSDKSIPVMINKGNSFRILRKFLKDGIVDNSIVRNLQEVDLNGYVFNEIDYIIIQSTDSNKQGRLRFKQQVK